MHQSIDLFTDDMSADVDQLPESNFEEEQRGDADDEQEGDENNENDDDGGVRRVVKPKKLVRNPQVKLNAELLKGPRGLTALPGLFKNVKFNGQGREEQDLNAVLKTYEYWCHRMFPKFTFDECAARLETLGNKKPVITFVKKIRMGLIEEERKILPSFDVNNDEEENRENIVENPPEMEVVEIPELSEEVQERIRENREKAMKLRAERLRKIQEKAQASLKESQHVNNDKELVDNVEIDDKESNSQETDFDAMISSAYHHKTPIVEKTRETIENSTNLEMESLNGDTEDILSCFNTKTIEESKNKQINIIDNIIIPANTENSQLEENCVGKENSLQNSNLLETIDKETNKNSEDNNHLEDRSCLEMQL